MSTSRYFDCTDRDRAAFEAGIKLGALFHQYIGSPVNMGSAPYMEEAIRRAVMAQPYVKEAEVTIVRDELARCQSSYGYASLSERMLSARVVIMYKGIEVVAELGWIDEIGYPLMRIVSVTEDLPR